MDQPPHDAPESFSTPPDTDDFGMATPSPKLAAIFAKTGALMDGLTREQTRQAAREFYFDADG